MLTMNAYGQTSDASSGFLRDYWECGSLTTEIAVSSCEEYGWQEPNQRAVEFVPRQKGKPFSPSNPLPVLGEH